MRYAVLNFSQEEVVKNKLDANDLFLLDYVYEACASPRMKKMHDDNEQTYVWLHHKKVLEDLPFLGFKESMLKKRLYTLSEKGLISSIVKSDETRGRRTYYTITSKCENMRYTNQVENITLNPNTENDQVENITLGETRPRVINYPSDNTLISDNTLDNTFTNVKVAQPTVTPIQDKPKSASKRKPLIKSVNNTESISDIDINSANSSNISANDTTNRQITSNTSITSNMGVVSPIKKKNLYEKCMDEIDAYTDDEEIKDLLKTYLPIRFARKDIVINLPTFRGMLKTLNRVAETRECKIESIQQSIDRQYPTFYAPHKRGGYDSRKKFAEGSKGLKNIHANTQEDLDDVL